MDLYSSAVRPLLFRLSADTAHELGRFPLQHSLAGKLLGAFQRADDPRLATDLAGLALSNPVGLAPGLDKDGDLLPGLEHLGFGYVTVGSIMAEPRKGNPRPRLVRYVDSQSISNAMGLPSKGVDKAVELLKRPRRSKVKVIASVAGFSPEEIVSTLVKVEPYVEATEVGLVCPNSSESERMQELAMFEDLTERLHASTKKPTFVKLPPPHSKAEIEHVRSLVKQCIATGIAGVSVNGGHSIPEEKLAVNKGSLAGRQIYDDSLRVIAEVAEMVDGQLAIRGAGGIFTGEHAAEMLRRGATTIEIYSAFIFNGWNASTQINRGLVSVLDKTGATSVNDI